MVGVQFETPTGSPSTKRETERDTEVATAGVWAEVVEDVDLDGSRQLRSRAARAASWIVLGVGSAAAFAFCIAALRRYFPALAAFEVGGVDGQPPSILAQPDGDANLVSRTVLGLAGRLTSWPNVLFVPVALGVVLGVAVGALRWRVGRIGAVRHHVRKLEASRTLAREDALQARRRVDRLEDELDRARHSVSTLTGQLAKAQDVNTTQSVDVERLFERLDEQQRHVKQLTADLEDAMEARAALDERVTELTVAMEEQRELVAGAALARERLEAADDMVAHQRRRIASLEAHLDRLRRRAGEMAEEVRASQQLRNAWHQAETVIADLHRRLERAESDQLSPLAPQVASAIVASTDRTGELETLLNDSMDQLEAMDQQLQDVRSQLRERDAALARTDAHHEALNTEIDLLNEEIELAAAHIAALEQREDRQRFSETVVVELRDALHAERQRSTDLNEQLSRLGERNLRLEQRLVDLRMPVVDLTGEPQSQPTA